jgi:hypothetical protein
MANMEVVDGKFVLSQSIESAGTLTKTLQTQNQFVDKNIKIVTVTPAGAITAGSTTATVTDVESILTESPTQPSSGEYITVSAQGAATVTTGGFIDEDTAIQSTPVTKYYTVQTATFGVVGSSVKATQKGYVAYDTVVATVNPGSQSITGGALSAGANSTAISSDGYYDGSSYTASDKVTLATTEATGYYKITSSGSATVNRAVVNKQVTTAGYFSADSSPVSAIAADSLTVTNAPTAYYIKKSTLSASAVTSSNVAQTVTVGEGYYPEDRTITIAPMTEVTPTTSLANTGLNTYFTDGTSTDNSITLTPRYSTSAGYVSAHTNTTNGGVTYKKIITTTMTKGTTTVSGTTATRGNASWGTGWITSDSMSPAAFKNSATSGKTYVDISNTSEAPVLVSGDYLYIDAGYTDYLKIKLSKLVPDGSDVKGHSEYILSGHSAYDNDGTLVAGSIPTYNGAYTVA